jgi:hypothetical protein
MLDGVLTGSIHPWCNSACQTYSDDGMNCRIGIVINYGRELVSNYVVSTGIQTFP